MHSIIAGAIVLCYDNIAIVLVLLLVTYYLVFRRNVIFFEILHEDENLERDTLTTYCTDVNCVRCNRYEYVAGNVLDKLGNITDTQDAIIASKVNESLFPNCASEDESRRRQNPNVAFYNDLLSVPYWSKETFADTLALEEKYSSIVDEFKNVYDTENMKGWKRNTTPNGSWDVFPLISQGCVISDNADRCQQTMITVQSLSYAMLRNVFSNVVFSVVRDSTIITEHYGPTNLRLRCHLGLRIPPHCALTVSDEVRRWEAGKCLIFDDSFLHSVTYDTNAGEKKSVSSFPDIGGINENEIDDYRAILIVDFWHPLLSTREREILDYAFSPVASD